MKRLATTLAALAALLIAPLLSDALTCMAARACAVAPCCVKGAHACPMHPSGAKQSCRAHSCWDDTAAAQAPPVVTPVAIATTRVQPRTEMAPEPGALHVPFDVTPPEPPPPRLSVL